MRRLIIRAPSFTVALLLIATWLVGCGTSSSTPTGSNRTAQPSSTPTQAAPPQPLALVGPVTVVSNSASGTGYEGEVVFHVKNANAALAAVNVPFRFTVTSQGKTIYTSDGSDRVSVGPTTTRLVVGSFRPNNITSKPDAAAVVLYSDPSLFQTPNALPDASKWRVEHIQYSCGQYVECEVNADLTWQGTDPQTSVVMEVAIHQGTSVDGPVLAAGTASAATNAVAPGQMVPVTNGILSGFEQPQGYGYSAQLPSGPLTAETYVESWDDTSLPTTPATP